MPSSGSIVGLCFAIVLSGPLVKLLSAVIGMCDSWLTRTPSGGTSELLVVSVGCFESPESSIGIGDL